MTPRDFFRALREGYVVVIVAIVVAVAAAVAVLVTQPTAFRASSFVHVEAGLPDGASPEELAAATSYANARTITYEALVDSDALLEPVIDELALDVDPRDLATQVAGISALDTNVIEIRVTWPDAEQSAEIANALAAQLADDVETANDELEIDLVVVTRAEASTSPVVPNPAVTVGLAVFAALLVATLVIFLRAGRRARASLVGT